MIEQSLRQHKRDTLFELKSLGISEEIYVETVTENYLWN